MSATKKEEVKKEEHLERIPLRYGSKTFDVQASFKEPVSVLLQRAREQHPSLGTIEATRLRLLTGGKGIDPTKSLSEQGIQSGDTTTSIYLLANKISR